MNTRSVLLLGSTGSIGTQATQVIDANPHRFTVAGICAGGRNPELIAQQAKKYELEPKEIAVAHPEAAKEVSRLVGGRVHTGEDAAEHLVATCPADIVLNGLVGSMGLKATLRVLEMGETLALANKESLVAGGELVLGAAQPGQIVPVDSEHSAMAQCLRSGKRAEVDRFVLTASGGPFKGWTKKEMDSVTPVQAAQHPTWSMGAMNTLNSATLVNKGLELIEASLLFSLNPDRIDVVVHPQSIIHSMVTFTDGATIAQVSPPSMLLPIAHALAWPERVPKAQHAMDWTKAHTWTFEPLDTDNFPAVELARDCAKKSNGWPAVYNAVNEQAADAFLHKRVKFTDIVGTIETILNQGDSFIEAPHTVEEIIALEKEARRRADEVLARLQ